MPASQHEGSGAGCAQRSHARIDIIYARSSARPPHAWASCVRAALETAVGARMRAVERMAGLCRHAASHARRHDRRRARASARRRCGTCRAPCRWCDCRSSSPRRLAMRGPMRRACGGGDARQSPCGSHAPHPAELSTTYVEGQEQQAGRPI